MFCKVMRSFLAASCCNLGAMVSVSGVFLSRTRRFLLRARQPRVSAPPVAQRPYERDDCHPRVSRVATRVDSGAVSNRQGGFQQRVDIRVAGSLFLLVYRAHEIVISSFNLVKIAWSGEDRF